MFKPFDHKAAAGVESAPQEASHVDADVVDGAHIESGEFLSQQGPSDTHEGGTDLEEGEPTGAGAATDISVEGSGPAAQNLY